MPRCEELIGTSWTAERPKRSLTSDERVGPVVGSTARKKDMGGWIVKGSTHGVCAVPSL